MNMKQIKELVALVTENGLSTLELNKGDTHILLKRDVAQPAAAPQPVAVIPSVPANEPGANFAEAAEIRAPMPGIFYAAASPDAQPFVHVGSHVRKGDVVCIIEAMKLMNEITADRDGEILDVCLQNGSVVEYGQALFKLN